MLNGCDPTPSVLDVSTCRTHDGWGAWSQVVRLEDASFIEFRNLWLQHSRSSAVWARNGTGIVVDNCTIANVGANATNIHGTQNRVTGSHVYGVGCMGISVVGGDHQTLTPAGNVVAHNNVHHYARWKRTYMPGIFWAGVGNTYSYNNVSYGPHNAILGGGNEADCYPVRVPLHVGLALR